MLLTHLLDPGELHGTDLAQHTGQKFVGFEAVLGQLVLLVGGLGQEGHARSQVVVGQGPAFYDSDLDRSIRTLICYWV